MELDFAVRNHPLQSGQRLCTGLKSLLQAGQCMNRLLLQNELTFHVAFQFLIFRLLFENSFRESGSFARVGSGSSGAKTAQALVEHATASARPGLSGPLLAHIVHLFGDSLRVP